MDLYDVPRPCPRCMGENLVTGVSGHGQGDHFKPKGMKARKFSDHFRLTGYRTRKLACLDCGHISEELTRESLLQLRERAGYESH